MKKFILFHLLIAFGIFSYAQNQNLLSGKFTREQLSGILIPQSKWTPFPKITDRAGWGKADQEMMKSFVAEAEKYINALTVKDIQNAARLFLSGKNVMTAILRPE